MKKKMIAGLMMLVMLLTILPVNVAQAATYKKGNYGSNVTYLQQNLAFLGCSPGSADGSYGVKTEKAVKALQKMLHMEENGIVDDTLDALIKDTIRDIQKYLQSKGYYSGELDGIKGPKMAAGYKRLQKELGYSQTGIFELGVARKILSDRNYSGSLDKLQEFVERCDGVYGAKNTEFMLKMADCISNLKLVNKEGIAKTNMTSDLANIMSEVSTKNGVWRLESRPMIEYAVKYSADLLLTLYNSILSDSMRLHKLQEIENTHIEECQILIDSLFDDAYQALNNMSGCKLLSSKNRERAEKLKVLLEGYQKSLPNCQSVFDYAVEMLKINDGDNVYVHKGCVYFVCANFDKKYVYNQNSYAKFNMPGRGNVGCTATALAISYSIYNNISFMPDNEDIAWDNAGYYMYNLWAPQMSYDKYYYTDVRDNSQTTTDDRLKYVYDNYVTTDIPVVIRLERVKDNTKGADNGHSVVVIGIRLTADLENLTYDDFLVADPNEGLISTLAESMRNGKYKLSSGWYLFYPNEAE